MQRPTDADPPPATLTTGAAFREGLTRPSLLSLAVAALVLLAPVLGLGATLDEGFMATPDAWRLALRSRDHGLEVTSTVMRAERTPPEGLRIGVLGASSTRDSVNAPLLETELERLTGRDVEVLNLSFGGQSLHEALAALERLADHGPLVAIVSAGAPMLGKGRRWATGPTSGSRLGFRADRIDAIVREAGFEPRAQVGNYFWDNRAFLLPRLPRLVTSYRNGMAELEVMPSRGMEPPPPDSWRRRTARQARRLRAYPENIERGMATLAEIADLDRRRDDLAMTILESPVNPRYIEEHDLDEIYADARRRLDEFGAERGLEILRLGDATGITEDDFVDGTHLRVPETIDRYTRVLAARIAAGGLLEAVR